MTDWRSRIVGLSYEDPRTLAPHPLNPKIHPPHQSAALRTILGELGWIGVVMFNDRTGRTIDGHDRVENAIATDQPTVPVLHVELDEAEEPLALATFDGIARMATTDAAAIDALLGAARDANPEASPELVSFLAGLHAAQPEAPPPPPRDGSRWTLEFPLDAQDAVRPVLEQLRGAIPALSWKEDTTV